MNKLTRLLTKCSLNKSRTYTSISKKPEITLYVRGFLSKEEKTSEEYDRWMTSHHKLIFKNNWASCAKTYDWDVGSIKMPPTWASGTSLLYGLYNNTKLLRSTNPWTLASTLAIDTTLLAGMVLYQYFIIEENANTMAPKLALKLINLSKKYERVRVICHSLGCKLFINAINYIPNKHKPSYVHLCAPTFNELEYKNVLNHLSKNKTYIYYTKSDIILSIALQLTKNNNPVGAFGLTTQYSNVSLINVTEYFNDYWIVHTNYHKEFHKFVAKEEHRKLFLKKYTHE